MGKLSIFNRPRAALPYFCRSNTGGWGGSTQNILSTRQILTVGIQELEVAGGQTEPGLVQSLNALGSTRKTLQLKIFDLTMKTVPPLLCMVAYSQIPGMGIGTWLSLGTMSQPATILVANCHLIFWSFTWCSQLTSQWLYRTDALSTMHFSREETRA